MANILIADDSQLIRQDLRIQLESLGHSVIEAEDGSIAVSLFLRERDRIDLVFSDINMPNLDGISFCRQVMVHCTENPGRAMPPVVALTTETKVELKAEGKKVGIVAWITKPFEADTVKTALQMIMQKYAIKSSGANL